MNDDSRDLAALTTTIVAGFVSRNPIEVADFPELITTVLRALRGVSEPSSPEAATPKTLTPAQIRKSITPSGLISFEDGRAYKMLKRHLTARGMTLADYKAKWGLPKDYPGTAPAYSAMRSQLAKDLGLGQKRPYSKKKTKA